MYAKTIFKTISFRFKTVNMKIIKQISDHDLWYFLQLNFVNKMKL